MGYIHYGGIETFSFEDRVLTHLRSVILGKMHMQESFVFTWVDGEQQHTIWIHPTIPIHFEFDSSEVPEIDPEWLEQLVSLANSQTGLRYVKGQDSNLK